MDNTDIPADRNKTDLTHDLTEASARWLASIGAKCQETEVPAGPKWISDLAAFWSPTPTEATLEKLIPRAKRYPYGESAEVIDEWKQHHEHRRHAYSALPKFITIIVEVKSTRDDFHRDRRVVDGKFYRRMADIQAIASPKGLLKPSEIPAGWWYVEHDMGGEVANVHRGSLVITTIEDRLELIASIAERRHNRTANAHWSALQKRQRMAEKKVVDNL